MLHASGMRNGYVDDLLHAWCARICAPGEDDLDRLGLGIDAASIVCAVVRRRRDSAPDGELLVAPPCPQTSFTSSSSRVHSLELVIVACNESHRHPLGIRTKVSSQKNGQPVWWKRLRTAPRRCPSAEVSSLKSCSGLSGTQAPHRWTRS